VHWVQSEQALAEMDKPLGDSYNEKLVFGRLAAVVLCQETKVACQLRVVCSCSDQAKGKNGAHRNFSIAVVSELVEEVHRSNLWMRDSQQAHCKGNCSLDRRLTVLEKVLHCSHGHLCSNLFAKRDKCNANNSSDLVNRFFVLLVLSA
jgi:DICT domain-containing protein